MNQVYGYGMKFSGDGPGFDIKVVSGNQAIQLEIHRYQDTEKGTRRCCMT